MALFHAGICAGSSQVARSNVISTPPLTVRAERTQPKSASWSVHGVACGSDVVTKAVRAGDGAVVVVGAGAVALGVPAAEEVVDPGPPGLAAAPVEPPEHPDSTMPAAAPAATSAPANVRFGMVPDPRSASPAVAGQVNRRSGVRAPRRRHPERAGVRGAAGPRGDDGGTMTLLERVRPPASPPGPPAASTSAYLLGAMSGLRAAGISLAVITVPLLAVWATAAQVTAGWTQALRVSVAGWLLVHHVAVAFPGGQVALTPLGLTLVPVLAVYRSSRRLAAEPLLSQGFSSSTASARPAAQALAGLTVAYAGLALLLALVTWSGGVHAVLWQAPIGPALLAAGAGAAGLLRGHPRRAALREHVLGRLPVRLRSTLRPAVWSAAVILGTGLVAVAYALVTNLARVESLHRALDPGALGGAVLVAGQAGYLPDFAAWAVAWLAGPGFAVGSGSLVSAGTVKLGVLPVVPALGALPTSPAGARWLVLAAYAVPVAAGGLVGWWTARRAAPTDLGPVSRLLDALLASVGAALLVGVAVALSRGAIGPGRMAHVGANPLLVTPFLALALAAGAAPVAALTGWWRSRSAAEAAVQAPDPAVEL